MRAVLFDLDGTLMDHDAAREAAPARARHPRCDEPGGAGRRRLRRVVRRPDALPDARLGIVTNGEGEPQRAKLAAIGLTDRFPVFVASADVGMRKPDAEIFLHACARLGVAPAEAAHVGDRLDLDAQGAAGAGLRGVWLDRLGAGGGASAGVATIATLHELSAALSA